MKKNELIEKLQSIPGNPDVVLFDIGKCLHDSGGGQYDSGGGTYSCFDIDPSLEVHRTENEESIRVIALCFDNPDYDEDGNNIYEEK